MAYHALITVQPFTITDRQARRSNARDISWAWRNKLSLVGCYLTQAINLALEMHRQNQPNKVHLSAQVTWLRLLSIQTTAEKRLWQWQSLNVGKHLLVLPKSHDHSQKIWLYRSQKTFLTIKSYKIYWDVERLHCLIQKNRLYSHFKHQAHAPAKLSPALLPTATNRWPQFWIDHHGS